jgi:hypothetical protein
LTTFSPRCWFLQAPVFTSMVQWSPYLHGHSLEPSSLDFATSSSLKLT